MALYSKLKQLPSTIQHNLLLRDTIIAWREVRPKFSFTFYHDIFPYRTIQCFLLECNMQPSPYGRPKGLIQSLSFSTWSQATLNPSKKMNKFSLSSDDLFHFWQCFTYAKPCCHDKAKRFQSSLIDCLIDTQQYSISDIYKLLNLQCTKLFSMSSAANWDNC